MTSSYVVFLLTGRLFGVKLGGAIEILPWRACRRVPLSYSYVEGLLDYRGTIYPVYNLAQRLGLAISGTVAAGAAQRTGQSIILVEENKMPFGIIVDSVVKMAKLEEQAAAPEKVKGIEIKFVKGTAHDEDHEVVILDFERLFHAG